MHRRRSSLLLGLAALVGLIVLAAGFALLAPVAPPLPPPDLQRLVALPGGGELPLGRLLTLAREGRPLIEETATQQGTVDAAASRQAQSAPLTAGTAARSGRLFWQDPVFSLAEEFRRQGQLDDALALYQSFSPGDPLYALAQRRIAWDILVLGRNDPAGARTYIRRALRADPLSGNSWQDTFRVHARLMGLRVD